MYSKILIPVDGSATSLKGLEEAIKLAKTLNAKVKLVHVINELLTKHAPVPSTYRDQIAESVRLAGMKTLTEASAVVHAFDAELDVETELIETSGMTACSIIIETANRWNADLIVMGTHGRRGLNRFALGSDAELVLRSTTVPVLMVRDTEKDSVLSSLRSSFRPVSARS